MSLKMSKKSELFLEKYLPEVANSNKLSDILPTLYNLIDEEGFAPPHYDTYNDFGREAQKVYDDIYFGNAK